MQSAMMPAGGAHHQHPHIPPTQPFTPPPSTDPSGASPIASTSTNPLAPPQPSYPSLAYPPSAGPSNYPPPLHQQHIQHNPYQYAAPVYPQHQQAYPRTFPNGPHQPHQQSHHQRFETFPPPHVQSAPYAAYVPQGYYPPPYPAPQLGGPGPGTLHNGYPYDYSHQPHLRFPSQVASFPPPPPPHHAQSSNQSIPSDQTDGQLPQPPPPDDPSTPQAPQPPPHDPSYGFAGAQGINGDVAHLGEARGSYHPYYPSNHPYTYGGGFGFQVYGPGPAQPMSYVYNNPGHAGAPNGSTSSQRAPSKGLNPAAQGFTFTPSAAKLPAPPQPYPTQRDILPNGHSEDPIPSTEAKLQLDLPSSYSAAPQAQDSPFADALSSKAQEGTLGLSQMRPDNVVEPTSTRQDLEAPPETAAPVLFAADTKTATAPSPESLPSPVNAPPAVTPTIESTPILSPESALSSPPATAAVSSLSFVGPSLSATSSSFGQTARSVSASSSSTAKKPLPKASSSSAALRLTRRRPTSESIGNVYNADLRGQIPRGVKFEQLGEDAHPVDRVKSIKKGHSGPSTRDALIRLDGHGGIFIARAVGQDLIFGTATPLPLLDTAAEIATAAVPSQPKVKPASWAALLRTPTSSTTATPSRSVAPSEPASSKLASPSRSVVSSAVLPADDDSEAGPSTPKGTSASLLVPPSTGAQSTGNARPSFNYAAAAAAGASLTPQEELAKLLVDGVKRSATTVGDGSRRSKEVYARGLINTGNMCFANTVLQVLVYCLPFTELFEELGKRLKADLARRTPLLEAMIIFLREFASPPAAPLGSSTPLNANGTSTPKGKGRESARREAFVPENVYDAMKENKRFDSMRRGYQEDAEEYLGFFINTLHEELLYLLSRAQSSTSRASSQPNGTKAESAPTPNGHSDEQSIPRPLSPDSGWLEVGKKQKVHQVRSTESRESAITRIFGGTLRSVLHAPGQKDSVTLEPYQPLQLDIQGDNVLTITDALRHISQPELVPGVWSQSRGENVDATKTVFVESWPAVLMLHLKRFVYDGQKGTVVKRAKAVSYGTELIIPPEIISPARRGASAIKYKLFGVVYHHGSSATGGHYTVAVLQQHSPSAGWLHFDDEAVQPVAAEEVVVSPEEAKEGRTGMVGGREKGAYLLFYQRVRA